MPLLLQFRARNHAASNSGPPCQAAKVRWSCGLIVSVLVILSFRAVTLSQGTSSNAADPSEVIQFLTQTIGWYRQLAVEQEIATEPNDLVVVNENRQTADQIVRFAFDFARALTDSVAKQDSATQSQNPGTDSSRYQSLLQLSAKVDKQARESQAELESLRKKLETATGKKRQSVQSAIAETRSELELAEARRESLRSMVEFVSGASANGLGATGLRAQVEALARSVPAASAKPPVEGGSPSAGSGTSKSEPSGLWGLAADLFALSRKLHTLDTRIRLTNTLGQSSKGLRAPLVARLKQLTQRGDALAKEPESEEQSLHVTRKQELDGLTAQFKQNSAAVLPLSKLGILLGLYERGLVNWQSTIQSRYTAEWRSLLLRLGLLGAVLVVIFAVAEFWRRTIFRYVHDARRRYQFLLLRKMVLWVLIAVTTAFAFATELGSVATFAGLLTAGMAVALQNVILSIVGYFFLIGRFGIRVGDRVQIAGVTGEVVDIGLVRLHLMELGGDGAETPTGRVVAFSNAILFQPTASLFKQIPGTNFVWHEMTLTLSPDSDHSAATERLAEAVEAVFAGYSEDMERQHREMERTLSGTSVRGLRPKIRLHLTDAGLEAVIRFPVDLHHAAEIDDRVTRELLQAIEQEPKLKLAGPATPGIRLKTEVST